MFLKLLLQVDGGEWRAVPDVSAICIGNAKYFGGGMKLPQLLTLSMENWR
jgi:hypothetical protein